MEMSFAKSTHTSKSSAHSERVTNCFFLHTYCLRQNATQCYLPNILLATQILQRRHQHLHIPTITNTMTPYTLLYIHQNTALVKFSLYYFLHKHYELFGRGTDMASAQRCVKLHYWMATIALRTAAMTAANEWVVAELMDSPVSNSSD